MVVSLVRDFIGFLGCFGSLGVFLELRSGGPGLSQSAVFRMLSGVVLSFDIEFKQF